MALLTNDNQSGNNILNVSYTTFRFRVKCKTGQDANHHKS